jgi:hypothetical protein
VKDYQLDADAALFRPSHPSTKSYALLDVLVGMSIAGAGWGDYLSILQTS